VTSIQAYGIARATKQAGSKQSKVAAANVQQGQAVPCQGLDVLNKHHRAVSCVAVWGTLYTAPQFHVDALGVITHNPIACMRTVECDGAGLE
ncbi:hypothetical protein HaLaN_28673, partial [Haematococcus lacustris]